MQYMARCFMLCCCFLTLMSLLLCSQHVTADMGQFLQRLRARVRVGVVGGSDLDKIKEQLGEDGETDDKTPELHPGSLLVESNFALCKSHPALDYCWEVVMRFASFSKISFVRP